MEDIRIQNWSLYSHVLSAMGIWKFSDPADILFWSLIPATFWSAWLLFACPDPIAYISQWYKLNIVLFVVYHVYYQPRNMEGQQSQVKYSGGGNIQSITVAVRRISADVRDGIVWFWGIFRKL